MGPNGEEMETAAIVTTTASRSISHIHDRMPVIVAPEAFDFWLDPNVDGEMAASVIAPARDALIEAYQVSSAVNRTANDMPALIEPLREPEPAEPPKPKAAKKEKAKVDDGQASLF
jgi:putative SOS response-associated peptidase YedK